ncbi:NAD-binding protein [Halomarina ordinaria]|uniref:NAD-binding protein n=1 Tax=Halomarina ordinaria TaxID=3033939 RepID=A0ABD5U815_9EURY|nr:NAD-binding protein [Halomarina sp. PSRA2]
MARAGAERVADVRRPRVAVLLTGVVAAVAIVTGVVALVEQAAPSTVVPVFGFVPTPLRQTAAFVGTLTGFTLLLAAHGLRSGGHLAWLAAVVLLPLAALAGVLQGSPVTVPVVVLALVALAVLVRTRRAFSRPTSLTSTQLAAVGAIVASQTYGTVGTWALRDQFGATVTNPVDAFYFALVTASTVGYGDVSPETTTARLFAMSVVVVGTSSFAVAAGALLAPLIEARFASALGTMSDRRLSLIDDHLVVAGAGDLTEPILEELLAADAEFVVVVESAERANALADRDCLVHVGDPSDEEPLRTVGIDRARAFVAATDDDAHDALSILTARELNPDLRVVAAATDRENAKKLKRAGADAVISPAVLGGHLLVRSALGSGGVEELAERLLGTDGDEAEAEADPGR